MVFLIYSTLNVVSDCDSIEDQKRIRIKARRKGSIGVGRCKNGD